MAANAARVFDDDLFNDDPAFRDYMDSVSDMITADYNSSVAPDFDEFFGQQETEYDGLSETEKLYVKDRRNLFIHYTGCVLLVVASFCLCMFMMVKGVSVKDDLDRNAARLTSLQQESVRLEADIKGKCELAAVNQFADDAGLHKASQFQTIYVGGQGEKGGIVSNAEPEAKDSGQIWAKLKSFFD